VFVDAAGHVYVVDSGNRRIRRVDATTGIITTIAGGGLSDGVPATESSLNRPFNVFATPAQDLYIADTGNHRIRRVDGDTGIITTVAGSGDAGFSGDGGPATQAQLSGPLAVAVDTEGHVYLADSGNARVRRVDAASGIITTVAGSGDSLGDGGAATEARLFWPTDVCVDEAGHLYVADPENRRIRRVDASTGIITTVAGTSGRRGGEGVPATQAGLLFPKGLVVDAAGHLFIADSQSGRIRRVDAVSGIITTVAGNGALRSSGDGKPATEAGLQPEDVSVDKAGNLYIAEWYRIRRVDALTGVIETYAGTRQRGFSGDGGSATRARINRAFGIAVDGAGNLFIADSGNDRIRRVTLDLTHVADDMLPEQTASDFALHQNSPNPFNPSTHIAYQLAEDGPVSLTIYGLLGQRLRVLVQEPQRAGAYHVAWDGRDSSGRVVATGIYVYRLTSSQGVLARRMLRMK
jgi:sugar lactone lactonase YvrE